MINPTMPGEDDLVKGQAELKDGLRLIYKTLNNYLTTQVIDIVPGDTLWNLAVKHYGDGQRWRELYMLNLDRTMVAQDAHKAKTTPDLIYSGNKLRILAI